MKPRFFAEIAVLAGLLGALGCNVEPEPEGIDEAGGWFYVAFNKDSREVVYRFKFTE